MTPGLRVIAGERPEASDIKMQKYDTHSGDTSTFSMNLLDVALNPLPNQIVHGFRLLGRVTQYDLGVSHAVLGRTYALTYCDQRTHATHVWTHIARRKKC